MKTRKLKSLGLDEAIKVNTLAQAKYFIDKIGFPINATNLVGGFIFPCKNNNYNFSWERQASPDSVIVDASDFIKPKKSKFKKLEKRVEALVSDVIALQSQFGKPTFEIGQGNAKPELQIGKWYKNSLDCLFCFTGGYDHIGKLNGYGFDALGDYCNDEHGFNPEGLVQATPEEVESALIKEAERRGYIGNRYKYNVHHNELYYGDKLCFINGKWAEILPNEEETIDWTKAGQLVESEYHIVVTTGNHDNERFECVVLKSVTGSLSNAIEKRNNYSKCRFKPFKGELTLKNE